MLSKATASIHHLYCDWRYRPVLSAYLDIELDAHKQTQVKRHLEGCAHCSARLEDMRFASRLGDGMSILVETPTGIPLSLRKRLAPSAPKRTGMSKLVIAPLAAMLLVSFGIVAVWYYTRQSKPSWDVARLDGAPQIGSARLSKSGHFRVGEWLETDGSSRAMIEVADIGYVEVEPNSRLRLVETRPTEHRLALARGRMRAHIWAPPRLFFVETPSATAVDYGCAYTLEVDDSGKSLLHVTEGWVALESGGRKSLVPAGAYCETRPVVGPGTPYFEGASEEFRSALSKLDFENDDGESLTVILSEAVERDALTLWHLLSRVGGDERERVYDRLASLASPPDGVTRDGVMRLDRQMLDSWSEKINAAPGDRTTDGGVLAPKGNMASPRSGHTATLLPDSRVLIAGGMVREGVIHEGAELYDPDSGAFELTGAMSAKRVGHTATLLPDGKVLITGGWAGDRPTASAEVYDSSTGRFTPTGDMSTERVAHGATLLSDGRVLITGGQASETNKLASTEIYDPISGIFTSAGNMTTPRMDHTATLLHSGKVLITGGSVGLYPAETVFSSAELYDPQSGAFSPTGGMTAVRFKHAAALLPDGKVLVIGGSDARVWRGRYASAEIYDPATGTFKVTESMGAARFKHREAVLPMADGKVLVAGGGERLEVYDPATGMFSTVASEMGTARFYSTATLLRDGTVLITGGLGQSSSQDASAGTWLYRPQ